MDRVNDSQTLDTLPSTVSVALFIEHLLIPLRPLHSYSIQQLIHIQLIGLFLSIIFSQYFCLPPVMSWVNNKHCFVFSYFYFLRVSMNCIHRFDSFIIWPVPSTVDLMWEHPKFGILKKLAYLTRGARYLKESKYLENSEESQRIS